LGKKINSFRANKAAKIEDGKGGFFKEGGKKGSRSSRRNIKRGERAHWGTGEIREKRLQKNTPVGDWWKAVKKPLRTYENLRGCQKGVKRTMQKVSDWLPRKGGLDSGGKEKIRTRKFEITGQCSEMVNEGGQTKTPAHPQKAQDLWEKQKFHPPKERKWSNPGGMQRQEEVEKGK